MLLIDTDKLETHIHTQARVTEGETKERRTTNNRLVRGDDFDDGSLFSLCRMHKANNREYCKANQGSLEDAFSNLDEKIIPPLSLLIGRSGLMNVFLPKTFSRYFGCSQRELTNAQVLMH